MENTGHISLSRQLALQRELDIVANNLANLNTNGYRGERLAFVEYLQKTETGDEFTFVQGIATVRDLSEGQKIATHNDLDLAIEGEGYFELETENGLAYTRDGAFRLNGEGELVTRQGHRVLGEGDAPIVLSQVEGQISVSEDGIISSGNGPIGQVKVVRFEDERALVKMSGGLYDSDGQLPEDAENFALLQGYVEGSNVTGIVELTRMMQVVQNYSAASDLIDQEHQRQRRALDILGARSFS